MPPSYRGAVVRTVIEVKTLEGAGTEADIYRIVTRYIDPETGAVLAVSDPAKDGGDPDAE